MGILVVHVAQFLQTLFGVVCIKLLRVGGVEQHSHRDVVRDWWERRCHFGSSGSSMAPKSSLDCSLREGGNSVSGPTTALIPSILSCRVPNCYAGFHLQSFSSVVSFPFFFFFLLAMVLVLSFTPATRTASFIDIKTAWPRRMNMLRISPRKEQTSQAKRLSEPFPSH